MANKKQIDSFNKIQSIINTINLNIGNKNFKMQLVSRKASPHWYEYIVYSVQNVNENIVSNKLYSGRPEAVIGYLKGFIDAMTYSNNDII